MEWWSALLSGQRTAEVLSDRVRGADGARVVHPGRADDAELREGLVARAVADGDDRRRGQSLDRVLATDAHHRGLGGGGLAEQREQDDLLLERLEHGLDGEREVLAEAGEVRGAGDHDALLAALDDGLDERGGDGGDGRALVAGGLLGDLGERLGG